MKSMGLVVSGAEVMSCEVFESCYVMQALCMYSTMLSCKIILFLNF